MRGMDNEEFKPGQTVSVYLPGDDETRVSGEIVSSSDGESYVVHVYEVGNTLVPRRFIETDDESRNGPTKLSLLELLTHHFHLKGGTARAKQLLLRAQTRNFSAGEQFEQLQLRDPGSKIGAGDCQ